MRRLLAIALIAVALVSCGGDDDDDSESIADDCLEVDQGVGMVPIEGAAWKSPDYEDATFIAMSFSATGSTIRSAFG